MCGLLVSDGTVFINPTRCIYIYITADSTFSLFFVSVVAMVAGRR